MLELMVRRCVGKITLLLPVLVRAVEKKDTHTWLLGWLTWLVERWSSRSSTGIGSNSSVIVLILNVIIVSRE
jgi:hypothetical protein